MALSNQELNALLQVFNYAGDLDALSELIDSDVDKLKAKLLTEMNSQLVYELECG